jgi:hypothetical protein
LGSFVVVVFVEAAELRENVDPKRGSGTDRGLRLPWAVPRSTRSWGLLRTSRIGELARRSLASASNRIGDRLVNCLAVAHRDDAD